MQLQQRASGRNSNSSSRSSNRGGVVCCRALPLAPRSAPAAALSSATAAPREAAETAETTPSTSSTSTSVAAAAALAAPPALAPSGLLWVKLAAQRHPAALTTTAAAALALALLSLDAGAAHAEGDGPEFLSNVARYGRYFVTVMLGTGYVMLKPLAAAFQRPGSALLALALVGGGFVVVKFTLDAMLGLSDPTGYEMNSIVPYGN
jgi:hypothetical protein